MFRIEFLMKKLLGAYVYLSQEWSEGTFPFLYLLRFQKYRCCSPPGSTREEDKTCAYGLFYTKFIFKQLLFKAFFDVMHIFGGIEPQTESTSPFRTLLFFKDGNLSNSLAPPGGRQTYGPADFFVRNSISNNFYLKLF